MDVTQPLKHKNMLRRKDEAELKPGIQSLCSLKRVRVRRRYGEAEALSYEARSNHNKLPPLTDSPKQTFDSLVKQPRRTFDSLFRVLLLICLPSSFQPWHHLYNIFPMEPSDSERVDEPSSRRERRRATIDRKSFAESPLPPLPPRSSQKKKRKRGSQYYTIKGILDERKVKGHTEFLLDWEGTDPSTGEPYKQSWVRILALAVASGLVYICTPL
jgi:hypothetical protein